MTYLQFVAALRSGTPPIAVRSVDEQVPGVTQPEIWLYVHTLGQGEEIVLARRIKDVLTR